MHAGIRALRDATRALRGHGAARKGSGADVDRSALIELSLLEDRLSGFADDQRGDDWSDFWLTAREVDVLRAHIVTIAHARGLSPGSVPALHVLADELATVAQRAD